MRRVNGWWSGILLVASAAVATAASGQAPAATAGGAPAGTPKGRFDDLKLREVGPVVGGRVSRVCGVAGDPRVYYAASAQGGVWKSEDGGRSWKPIFDDQPVASIGSVAVAPSDPNVVWVGSGEANIRGNVIGGRGIFRSTDAGKSWTRVWDGSGQVGALAVAPADPDIAFAAVLGHAFGPNAERGVYRTLDGGATWKQVLSVDADTGASDVAIDPDNPRIVFAGTWQARRTPWSLTSGGPGSGLYRSTDGGETWTRLAGHGLPAGIWGKVGVAVAPSEDDRVYALIEAEDGGLFRSDDGGDTWKHVNDHHALRQRAWYYSTLTVDPVSADVVWFPQVNLLRTLDGGRTIQAVTGTHHGDHHDLWIDPSDHQRMIVATDGGVEISLDGGAHWTWPRLPVAELYNIDADDRVPYHVGGTMQDFGTASGPSDSLRDDGIFAGDWLVTGGGEAGDFAYDRSQPGIVYAGEYGGVLTVADEATGETRNVSIYPTDPSGHAASDLRYRFQWTAPIAVAPGAPGEPDVIYHGANVLFRSTDRGRTWQAISPDLTRNDPVRQQWSGGPITGDNTGVEVYDTIFSIAVSPLAPATLWVGTDDGLVQVTHDSGSVWSDVTPPGMPEWGTVETIEASPHDAGEAWVVVDTRRLDDLRPHLFRTSDGGTSWSDLSRGLPQDESLLVVREDPARTGLLYAGTERGLYLSFDGGATWQRLHANLPTVAITDLAVRHGDLVVGTSGRGIWILDDLSPIRGWSEAIAGENVHLFAPRPAIRWSLGSGWNTGKGTTNPPRGLVVDYWLREAAEGEVTLEILDADGRTVRRLSSTAEPPAHAEDDPDEPTKAPEAALSAAAGLHRAVWDLNWKGARRLEDAKIDAGDPTRGPRALPGSYTLRLSVGGKQQTASAEVAPDPRSRVPAAELASQLDTALDLRQGIDAVENDVRRLRAMREQADELFRRLADDPDAAALVEAAGRLSKAAGGLEARFHNPKAQVVYDILAQKGGTQLLSNLIFLYSNVIDGDGAPTQGMTETAAALRDQRADLERELAKLESGELADVDRISGELGLPRVLLPAPAADGD
jgi:photosystem II stability/assembly factor-like uncharacterized protein